MDSTADSNMSKSESSTDTGENKKREAFGNRHLTRDQNVFDFNAWYMVTSLF